MRLLLRKYVIPVAIFLGGLTFCVEASFAASILESKGALDFTYDIRSMIRLNPDFSTYPDADGIIWLKQLDYRSAPNGGIERRSLWIILGRRGLASRWLSWNIPAPQEGSAEILEASAYSPLSSQKIAEVPPVDLPQGGGQSVSFTDLPEEFILVVSYREFFANRLSIDDLVWVSEPLPVWEELIGVTVPTGNPFYHDSSPEIMPRIQEIDGRRVYEWRIINTPAQERMSLRNDERAYVAFGMREGREVAARFLKNLEPVSPPPLPDPVRRMIGKNADAKGIEDLLKWLYRQPEYILPDCTVREIPAEAPWTDREKVLLAYGWLKNAGVDVHLFWRLAYRPEPGKPACESQAMSPILEVPVRDPKKDPFFYCDMSSLPRFGENSPLLRGQVVYGVENSGRIGERRISGFGASDNLLSAVFNLSLGEDGIIGGTIRIQLRNGWRHFLLPPQPSDDDLALLIRNLFPLSLRYSDIKLKGDEIVLTLAEIQAIKGTGGRNILVTLPALIPSWFESLSRGPYPYTLDFPFTMNARIVLSLPPSVENVMLPAPADRDMGKIKYTESWKLNKKKSVSAEARMTVASTAIADDTAANLNSALQGWHLFMTKNLPVRLKVKNQ